MCRVYLRMGISVIAELDVEQRARKAAFSCDGRVGSSRAACLGWWATLQNPTLFFFLGSRGATTPPAVYSTTRTPEATRKTNHCRSPQPPPQRSKNPLRPLPPLPTPLHSLAPPPNAGAAALPPPVLPDSPATAFIALRLLPTLLLPEPRSNRRRRSAPSFSSHLVLRCVYIMNKSHYL